jgi:hypothetical protein
MYAVTSATTRHTSQPKQILRGHGLYADGEELCRQDARTAAGRHDGDTGRIKSGLRLEALLPQGLCKILTVSTAPLNVVFEKSDMYCHFFSFVFINLTLFLLSL